MNNCVLMAEIVKAPELRYMQDGQTAIAEMTVQFPALKSEDPMETMKVVGWGNLAQQIQEQFHEGDQVVIEGRLNMVLTDRPEGFKEKRAELTVNRVHKVQVDLNAPRIASTPAASMQQTRPPQPAVAATPTVPRTPAPAATPASAAPAQVSAPTPPPSEYEPNYDDIPF
jgi:single-strand DNA-binding protein